MANVAWIWGIGRRKSAVARVRLIPGDGKITVNDKDLNEYFRNDKDRASVRSPLADIDCLKKYNVFARVNGGGMTGQAGAVRLGIARAMNKINAEAFHSALREGNHLTRDPRMKERKKYGHKAARKSFQFSKR